MKLFKNCVNPQHRLIKTFGGDSLLCVRLNVVSTSFTYIREFCVFSNGMLRFSCASSVIPSDFRPLTISCRNNKSLFYLLCITNYLTKYTHVFIKVLYLRACVNSSLKTIAAWLHSMLLGEPYFSRCDRDYKNKFIFISDHVYVHTKALFCNISTGIWAYNPSLLCISP